MTGEERILLALDMSLFSRELARERVRCDHPEWNGTTLTWKIEQDGDRTSLNFTHSGWKSATEFCASCNTMWGNLLFRLKGFAEGRNPGPQWKE